MAKKREESAAQLAEASLTMSGNSVGGKDRFRAPDRKYLQSECIF